MQKYKYKKGQASLVFNVIIGLIFILATLAVFMLINARIGDLKESSISDVQQSDVYVSYLGTLRLMNESLYKDFIAVNDLINPSDFYFYRNVKAATINQDVLKASTKADSKGFVKRDATGWFTHALYLDKNGDVDVAVLYVYLFLGNQGDYYDYAYKPGEALK